MTIAVGTLLGPYKILSFIGKGGMGEVYQASDERLGRNVAIKVLPAETSQDTDSLKRLTREAKALATLSHPNIVTIHDVGNAGGISFVVMEFLEGHTLRTRIPQTGIPWKSAVEIAIPVGEALSAAHSKGVIHKDLKPENIFLTSKDAVKILDFGLARFKPVVSENQVTQTPTISQETYAGKISGTLQYMSPEHVQGAAVDARSDIFSFGCVLYEMITGKRPFSSNSAAETIAAILKENPVSLSEFGKNIPPELEHIVYRCLEKNPDKRFQSAADLAFALREVLSAAGVSKTISQLELTHPPRTSLFRYVSIALVLLLLAGIGWWLRKSTILKQKTREKSIAVLPFRNMNPDKESEYFSDGITEDVLTQLSKIGDLRVISRTSIMRYKNTDKTLQEIGKELKVANVLEGSVRREGNRIRIVGQLIDAQTDEHIWAETYDREMKDVFEIQSDVALQIAKALKTKLSPVEKERIERKPTDSVMAYDYYLKGRQYYSRYTKQDNENAIQLFKKAVEVDPNYALAYAGLGHAFMRRQESDFDASKVDLAMDACDKAIALDPNLAEAYDLLHKIYGYKGWSRKSFEAIRKAVELNPSAGVVNLSVGYIDRGDLVEGMRWINKAIALDPTQPFPYLTKGTIYFYLDDLPKAESSLLKSLELQPDFVYPHNVFVELYIAQDMLQKANEHAQKAISIDSDSAYNLEYAGKVELLLGNAGQAKRYFQKSMELRGDWTSVGPIYLAYILTKEGNKDKPRKILEERRAIYQDKINQGSENYFARYNLAAIHAIEGNKAEAFRWLQDAIDAGSLDFRWMMRDPLLENLRGDPKFQQMMAQIKTRVDGMRSRIEQSPP